MAEEDPANENPKHSVQGGRSKRPPVDPAHSMRPPHLHSGLASTAPGPQGTLSPSPRRVPAHVKSSDYTQRPSSQAQSLRLVKSLSFSYPGDHCSLGLPIHSFMFLLTRLRGFSKHRVKPLKICCHPDLAIPDTSPGPLRAPVAFHLKGLYLMKRPQLCQLWLLAMKEKASSWPLGKGIQDINQEREATRAHIESFQHFTPARTVCPFMWKG